MYCAGAGWSGQAAMWHMHREICQVVLCHGVEGQTDIHLAGVLAIPSVTEKASGGSPFRAQLDSV